MAGTADGIVIGGGVAGLGFAAAMRQRGQDVTLLEGAATLRASGSGLILGPTAIRALRCLGLADEAIAIGRVLTSGGLADLALRPLGQEAFGHFSKRTGEPFVGIERGLLVQLLAEAAPACRTSARYTDIAESDRGVAVTLADGEVLHAPWVVLADGIRSVGRAAIAASAIRDAGQWCWRGIAEGVDIGRLSAAFVEAWGSEWRFGIIPVGGGRTYWFIVQRDSAGSVRATESVDERLGYVTRAAARLLPLLSDLVAATPKEQILENRLEDLAPLARWHSARIICIGDAAHAMTPNLGQGATQALEDAVILAAMMADSDPADAFARFEAFRRPRTERTVREARMIGRLAHVPRVLTGARNALLRAMPRSLSFKQLAWLYEDAGLYAAMTPRV